MVNNKFRGIDSIFVAKKIEQLVNQNLLTNPNSIFKSQNCIRAFGVYTVHKCNDVYNIYKKNVNTTCTFSAKSALAWCISDKYHIKSLKSKILTLDHSIAYKQSDILFLKHTLNSEIDPSRKFIIEDKLQTVLMKLKHDKNQLSKCLNSAKYYQLKGFENETSRLGIKSSSGKHAEGI